MNAVGLNDVLYLQDQVQLGKQSNAGSADGEQTGVPEDASTNHRTFVPAPQTVCTVQ